MAGRSYRVDDVAGAWQSLRSIDPLPTAQTVTVADPAAPVSGPARFYRLTAPSP